MAAAPGRPEAASSARLGGAKLSSNYRQPAPGQPQPVPSIPSEARNCGLKSAAEAARRRSVGRPVSCHMQPYPGPSGGSELAVHHAGGILSGSGSEVTETASPAGMGSLSEPAEEQHGCWL